MAKVGRHSPFGDRRQASRLGLLSLKMQSGSPGRRTAPPNGGTANGERRTLHLRRQPINLPTSIRALCIKKTVVQSVFAPLPEFKSLRNQQVASPEFRKRR